MIILGINPADPGFRIGMSILWTIGIILIVAGAGAHHPGRPPAAPSAAGKPGIEQPGPTSGITAWG